MDPPAALVDERLQLMPALVAEPRQRLGADRAGIRGWAEPLLLALGGPTLPPDLPVDGDLDLLVAIDLDLNLGRLEHPVRLRARHRCAVEPPHDGEFESSREPLEDLASFHEVGQIVARHQDHGEVAGRPEREEITNGLPGWHWRDRRSPGWGLHQSGGGPVGVTTNQHTASAVASIPRMTMSDTRGADSGKHSATGGGGMWSRPERVRAGRGWMLVMKMPDADA